MKIANRFLKNLAIRRPELEKSLEKAEELLNAMIDLYDRQGTFFIAGNGGSAADSDHICGELLKGFRSERKLSNEEQKRFRELFGEEGDAVASKLQSGLRAVSLLSHPGLNSAFANDVDPDLCFAQQLWALAKPGDLFLAISTGGGAKNLRLALMAARAKGMKSALLTGNRHGICEKYADIVIDVPESETYLVQEMHLPIYHALCLAVEANYWEEKKC